MIMMMLMLMLIMIITSMTIMTIIIIIIVTECDANESARTMDKGCGYVWKPALMRPYPPNHLAARDTDCFEVFLVMVMVDVNVVVMLGILVVVMMTA